ncbi:MAG TPA: hypothetical protein VKG62_05400 [Solirubrobacteraceae bacterium]|nr:hypothetical protein [Solirubrobacteraceae bacterium]
MSAKNGLLRSRSRLVGLAVVAAFALSAMLASTASAKPPIKETYLALGDSVAFGYSAQLLNENLLAGDPATDFEHGYANYYLTMHKPVLNGIQLTNDGCPGETTDSVIGNGALAAALGTEPEAPCAYHNVDGLPLHNEYGGPGVSQLENALGVIAVDSFTGKPVTTITLNIGANDELHAIAKCEAEVIYEFTHEPYTSKYGATPEAAVKGCLEAHAAELFTHILTNIGTISYVLHNGALFGGVNWAGKLVFLGSYDPYGTVYKTAAEVATAQAVGPQFAGAKLNELLTGSLPLAQILNLHENAIAPGIGACFANVLPVFNSNTNKEPGEKGTLQKWTNMNNQTSSNGQPNGPDIHPTPVGYKKLAKLMTEQCG